MGRTPCCSGEGLKKGAWTEDEDKKLVDYIAEHGEGGWRSLPQKAGLLRCGKSCRLRWANYLRPGIKRGEFSVEEEETVIRLQSTLGNKWSSIANQLLGRTDNEIKNHWNTRLKRLAAERRVIRNAAQTSPEALAVNNDTSTEVDNSSKKLQEIDNSAKSKSSISPSSKLLNEVAVMLRASGSLASLMSQQVGTSKSLEGSSVPSASSARLLNQMATTLGSLSPKSHSLDAIKALFSKSIEGGVSGTTSNCINNSFNSENNGIGNSNSSHVESTPVIRQTNASASARMLNRMASKLALNQHRPHLLVIDSGTVSSESPDPEPTRMESLASEPSLLTWDSPQLILSHSDGTTSGTCGGEKSYNCNQDLAIEDNRDLPFLTEIDDHDRDHDDQKEKDDQNVICEYDQFESFLNGDDSDEVIMTSASTSPVEANIACDLEAANFWNDSFFVDEFFNAAIIQGHFCL